MTPDPVDTVSAERRLGDVSDTQGDWSFHRRRNPAQWVGGLVALAIAAVVVRAFAKSDIAWGDVPEYFASTALREGVYGTIKLTVATMALAIVLGTLVAAARQSRSVVLLSLSAFYIWLFRGVPTLVQLLLWFNASLVVPTVNLGPIYSGSTNDLMTPFMAGLLGLGLAESAYIAEIMRGGILSVPKGQVEAAYSVGMRRSQVMRRVILPQAVRIVIPPIGNQVVGMLKYTSLAFAVSYNDLLGGASRIYTANFAVIEVLFAATLWYLILVSAWSVVQRLLERYFDGPLSSSSRAQLKLSREAEL